PTENGVALRPSFTTDTNLRRGRHRALPEVEQSTAMMVPTYRRLCPMKNFLGALMVSIALTSPSFGFCLLDKMLGSGCGCCCEPSCSCCEKSCCCEKRCGCEKRRGCDKRFCR